MTPSLIIIAALAAELSRLDGEIMDRVFILDTITTIPTITAP